jgi:hypothetical protein
MAGRAHKRLVQQLNADLPAVAQPAGSEAESSEDDSEGERTAPFNPFSLLSDDEASELRW